MRVQNNEGCEPLLWLWRLRSFRHVDDFNFDLHPGCVAQGADKGPRNGWHGLGVTVDGHGDVTVAHHLSGGWVKPFPARTRQVYL